MKLSGNTIVNANRNDVFAAFADFEFFEKSAVNSGAKVRRVDTLSSPGPGMKWDSFIDIRGKSKKLSVELVDYDPPSKLDFQAVTAGFVTDIRVDLDRRNAAKTKVKVSLDVTAQTLATRMMLKTARLTKSRLKDRMDARIAKIGRDIEARIAAA